MARPLRPGLKRPQQYSFPHIHGLYLLLRTLWLAVEEGLGEKTGRLRLAPEMFARWQTLNATEKYFHLLEAWWLLADVEALGERGRYAPGRISDFRDCWRTIPAAGRSFANNAKFLDWQRFYGVKGLWRLALCELFGLVEVDRGPREEGVVWPATAVRRSPFGEALVAVIEEKAKSVWDIFDPFDPVEDDELIEDDEGTGDTEGAEQEAALVGQLQPLFGPYFPEWRRNLTLPPREFRPGVFDFKVSLKRVWRTIAISAEDTLESQAWAIINAYRFDGDHLYEFRVRDQDATTLSIMCRYEPEDEVTDEWAIGMLPLDTGQSMQFIYDFGAEWRFGVTLEMIDAKAKPLKKPKVIASHGKPPREYEWDEEEKPQLRQVA